MEIDAYLSMAENCARSRDERSCATARWWRAARTPRKLGLWVVAFDYGSDERRCTRRKVAGARRGRAV